MRSKFSEPKRKQTHTNSPHSFWNCSFYGECFNALSNYDISSLFFCAPPLVSVCFMIKWSDGSSGQTDLTKRDYIVMLISVFMVQPFPCDPLIITNIYRAPHKDNNIILNGMYHSWNDINSFGSVTIFGIIDRRVNMKWAMIARYESRIDVTYRDRSTHFANSFI